MDISRSIRDDIVIPHCDSTIAVICILTYLPRVFCNLHSILCDCIKMIAFVNTFSLLTLIIFLLRSAISSPKDLNGIFFPFRNENGILRYFNKYSTLLKMKTLSVPLYTYLYSNTNTQFGCM